MTLGQFYANALHSPNLTFELLTTPASWKNPAIVHLARQCSDTHLNSKPARTPAAERLRIYHLDCNLQKRFEHYPAKHRTGVLLRHIQGEEPPEAVALVVYEMGATEDQILISWWAIDPDCNVAIVGKALINWIIEMHSPQWITAAIHEGDLSTQSLLTEALGFSDQKNGFINGYYRSGKAACRFLRQIERTVSSTPTKDLLFWVIPWTILLILGLSTAGAILIALFALSN